MKKINKIHDKMFNNVFRKVDNARTFLRKVLPEEIKSRIDFSTIEIEDTDYVSKQFEEYFSDIVVKVKVSSKGGGKIMQTLADQLRNEGKKKWMEEANLETARKLIKNGVDINIIVNSTGFPREEIEKLAATVH